MAYDIYVTLNKEIDPRICFTVKTREEALQKSAEILRDGYLQEFESGNFNRWPPHRIQQVKCVNLDPLPYA